MWNKTTIENRGSQCRSLSSSQLAETVPMTPMRFRVITGSEKRLLTCAFDAVVINDQYTTKYQ